MKLRNILFALLLPLLFAFGNNAKAQVSTPLIGIDTLVGIPDTIYIGNTYSIYAAVRNYYPNNTYNGAMAVLLNTNGQTTEGIALYIDLTALFTPNIQFITFDTTVYADPQYFVLGGGITTVVVWPQVNAPTTDPFIKQIVVMDTITGIKENMLNNAISLFPNPANDRLVIASTVKNNTVKAIRIFDISGKLVYDKPNDNYADKEYTYIDLTALSNGVYVVEAQTAKGVVRKKFVKL